ncbi:HAD-IA family hydrolase [Lysinibacter sp. HNR]|uniref:HAD-IA family hydrolase n=1 Tax=Lysinibacter sp. HNR TaxID=3031408 RepID=UPI002435A474|nr:HAD-IA family hydrolase [Lysinibacter sp. HNR]WGD37634.1 HAD-IA family hydrolase [Lysinibacter sp. HNR]
MTDNIKFTDVFDALLFDLDGTLIDSTPSVIRSWLRLAQEEGFDPRLLLDSHGKPAEHTLRTLVPAERVEAALQRINELEESDTEGIVALPGAIDLLTSLPSGTFTIVTSCTRVLARIRLRAAGLPEPDSMVTFDDVSQGKPHPEPFLLGASRLGADPTRCLVFEDAPAGLTAARTAGCATLGLVGDHVAGPLNADITTDSLTAVRAEQTANGTRVNVFD